jgi:hypothetical protein
MRFGLWTSVFLGAALLGKASGENPRTLAHGTWGGAHVSLDVSEKGATLEFDCARGSIEGPIRLDSRGRFDVKGLLLSESRGHVRVGHEPKPEAARYSGVVGGKKLKLWVKLSGSDQHVGAYSLVKGEQGKVRKCR